MAVVADPSLGSKSAWHKAVWSFAAAMVSLAIVIAFASFYYTGRFQQNQISNFTQASECRSQTAADADAEQYRATVVLLNSIVNLGNRQPLDFTKIAETAKALDAATAARLTSVQDCA